MCFATVAAVAGTLGAATSAFGTYSGGVAASNAAYYRAEVARNNKIIAEQNAEYAANAGQAQAAAQSLKGAATAGKIKTQQAASGISVDTGSAVDVQVGQREAEKLDTETVLNNAMLQAYGYRTQATGFEAEARLDTLAGENAKLGGEIGAVGSLLSNAGSIGMKWGGGNGGGYYGGSPETNPNLAPT